MKNEYKEVWRHGRAFIAHGQKSLVHMRIFAWRGLKLLAERILVNPLGKLILRGISNKCVEFAFEWILEFIKAM